MMVSTLLFIHEKKLAGPAIYKEMDIQSLYGLFERRLQDVDH